MPRFLASSENGTSLRIGEGGHSCPRFEIVGMAKGFRQSNKASFWLAELKSLIVIYLLTGVAPWSFCFSGVVETGFATTVPLMVNLTVEVFAFELTVMDLLTGPMLFVL